MKLDFFDYIQRHWQGKTPLGYSFWVNFVLFFFALNALERFVLPPYITGEVAVTTAMLIFTVVVRLIVYPWQVIGVVRACDRSMNTNIDRYWIIAAQGVVVMSIVATLASTFSSVQSVLQYKRSFLPTKSEIAPKYTLDLINQNSVVHLRGPFQSGITRRVSKLIADYPTVKGIILDSLGGQIAEGRGLARVIRENNLDTFCLDRCMSACTTAFAAGSRRTLGVNAKLGFHQYQAFTVYPQFDIDEEQAKDITLFKDQGISTKFLEKIFDRPPEDVWWPEHNELLEANVIHQIGFQLNNSGG